MLVLRGPGLHKELFYRVLILIEVFEKRRLFRVVVFELLIRLFEYFLHLCVYDLDPAFHKGITELLILLLLLLVKPVDPPRLLCLHENVLVHMPATEEGWDRWPHS